MSTCIALDVHLSQGAVAEFVLLLKVESSASQGHNKGNIQHWDMLNLPQLTRKLSCWCVEFTELKLRTYSLMSYNEQKQSQPFRRTATVLLSYCMW